MFFFFFSSRRRHTRSLCDWSSDVCSSDLLVALGEFDTREKADPGTQMESISYLDYVDWRDQTKVFEQVAVCTNQSVGTLTDGNRATHVQGESVSADLFPLLGVQPLLGRTFLPKEDEPGNYVVILS